MRMHGRAMIAIVGGLMGLGACGEAPKLDAAHLPAEARGLIPGVATEAEVVAAFPGAEVSRDRSFGGDKHVELSDRPAVAVRSPQDAPGDKYEAWLIEAGGVLRLASLQVPLARDCAEVAKAFGDRATADTCKFSNRRPERGEHAMCAQMPGSERKIWITCHDRRVLTFWLDITTNGSRSYRIAPLE